MSAEQVPGQGQEFTEDSLNRDPTSFWKQVHLVTMNQLSSVFAQQTQGFLQSVMNTIDALGKEVSIFRELETRVRNNTLTEEHLSDIMARVQALRTEISKKAADEAAALNALQNTQH